MQQNFYRYILCLLTLCLPTFFCIATTATPIAPNLDQLIKFLNRQESFFIDLLQHPDYATDKELAERIDLLVEITNHLQKDHTMSCNAVYQALAQSIDSQATPNDQHQQRLDELIAYHGIKSTGTAQRFPFMAAIAKHIAIMLKKSSEPTQQDIDDAVTDIHESCTAIAQELQHPPEGTKQETQKRTSSFFKKYRRAILIGSLVAAGIIVFFFTIVKPLGTKIHDLERKQSQLEEHINAVDRARIADYQELIGFIKEADQKNAADNRHVVDHVNAQFDETIESLNRTSKTNHQQLVDLFNEQLSGTIKNVNQTMADMHRENEANFNKMLAYVKTQLAKNFKK